MLARQGEASSRMAPAPDSSKASAPGGGDAVHCRISKSARLGFYKRLAPYVTKKGSVSVRACEKVLTDYLKVPQAEIEQMLRVFRECGVLLEGPDESTYLVPLKKPGSPAQEPARPRARFETHDLHLPKGTLKPIKEVELVDKLGELERRACELPDYKRALERLDQYVKTLTEYERPRLLAGIEACEEAQRTIERIKSIKDEE